MSWDVEFTDEFGTWWESLTDSEQDESAKVVEALGQAGPALGRPRADTLRRSRHPNMKELRVQSGGHPIRIMFAFDPRRVAILLIGGDKTGNPNFYDEIIPIADDLYDEHLAEIARD